jgi:serine/threonine-protein kinase
MAMNAVISAPEKQNVWAGYRLKRLRGSGAFGRVWEADAPSGEPVAFKIVTGKMAVAVSEIRNVRNVCQLSHPHILRIEKVWCEADNLIFVMELADGSLQDLADVSQLEFGVPLGAGAIGEYFRQAAEAIDFLNGRKHLIGGRRVGVQHRDIKPANLLLFGDQVKLCDFGLSMITAAPSVSCVSAGTPAYAAPEVFRGNLSDSTDQYALAVTYCQLRGGLPFADTPMDFRRTYARPTPDLGMLDAAERPIIARALSPVPQDRWPTCADMARQLLAITPQKDSIKLSERRLGDRRPCPHRPRIQVMTLGATIGLKATVVNLSLNGLGLLLDRPLGVGIDFTFLAPTQTGHVPRELSARVVRGMPQADGRWFVGCRLSAPFSAQEIEAIGSPQA